MAEYWKSTPKYWCKHCKTFVVDTKLARTQHEATGKHQGALQRFLRELHRNKEKETREKEAAKREVERLEAIASGRPIPSRSPPSGSSSSTTSSKPTKPLTEAERKAQMKQLEALGVALPELYRKEVAMPGEWVTVEPDPSATPAPTAKPPSLTPSQQAAIDSKEAAKGGILRKRKLEEEERKWEEMDEDEKALRGFKIQMKTYPRAEEEEVELGDLLSFGNKEDRSKKKVEVHDGAVGAEELKERGEEGSVSIKTEDSVGVNQDTGSVGASSTLADIPPAIAFKKRAPKNIRKK